MSLTRRATGLAVVALLLVGLAAPRPTSAASPPVTFAPPSGSFVFGTSITFSDAVALPATPKRVELLLTQPGSIGPTVIGVAKPGAGQHTLTEVLKLADGHIYPNTTFQARWRVTDTDGTAELGPSLSLVYLDTRFAWQTKVGPIVRVHWYQGDDAFGARALAIGEQGIANAAALLGVTETKPVDFYIYASNTPFYDALGPGTRENVGGLANAQIRTLFALITPSEINAPWVGTVIPHELTHLVFNTAIENPYHAPPRWLNEGLAVYLSEGYTPAWRSAVTSAVGSGGVIPLGGLIGQFPTTADQFLLAYGESVSAVDFMIRNYGKPALVKLIRSYSGGVSDDEAFSAALGVDSAGFNGAWLKDLGAVTPQAYGPQPAPAGPLPSGWNGASAPGASAPPLAVATEPLQSIDHSPEVIIGAVALLIAGLGFLFIRSRRRRQVGLP
jgi:hypothetical protein